LIAIHILRDIPLFVNLILMSYQTYISLPRQEGTSCTI
jgi:hypothetical protein